MTEARSHPRTDDPSNRRPKSEPTEMGVAKCMCRCRPYGSRGDTEPMVGLAVQSRALGAAAEGCDALVATGVMPAGVWP
jgi:hypothetical protein